MACVRKSTRRGTANPAARPSRRDEFAAFACEQLAGLPKLECRAMFGGHGLYSSGKFFGLLWRGALYFKTSPETVGDFLAADMGWFQPNEKQALKNYYEVPAHVLERRSELLAWARRAAGL